MKTLRVVAAIIENEEKILIAQRLKGEFAGLWEKLKWAKLLNKL